LSPRRKLAADLQCQLTRRARGTSPRLRNPQHRELRVPQPVAPGLCK